MCGGVCCKIEVSARAVVAARRYIILVARPESLQRLNDTTRKTGSGHYAGVAIVKLCEQSSVFRP